MREAEEKRRASFKPEVDRLATWLADPAHWAADTSFHWFPRAVAIIPSDLPVSHGGLDEFLRLYCDDGFGDDGMTLGPDRCFRVSMDLQDPNGPVIRNGAVCITIQAAAPAEKDTT